MCFRNFNTIGLVVFLILIRSTLVAQHPVVENVRFEQRTDGSLLVDIYYDVTTAGGLPLEVSLEASADDGITWSVPCFSLTGDVGDNIIAGTDKHVVWDFYADNPDTSGSNYCVRVSADCMVCGQTIMEDYTLTRDLDCPPEPVPVINIGASDITFDLGGHTIRGEFYNGIREYIIAEDVDKITIRNGTLDGFSNGIILGRSNYSVVENLNLKNLEIEDPEIAVSGIVISGSDSVVVQDSQFDFLYAAHKEAVISGNSNITVRNITTHNGSVGVNYGGSVEGKRSTGTVINCRFYDSSLAGVLVQQTDSARITSNEFKNTTIALDAAILGIVSGVRIDGNNLHDRPDGDAIQFIGGIESVVSNNVLRNFSKGIALYPSRGCGLDSIMGAECSYATGNLITNNTLQNNKLDLYHDEKCIGNTWHNNTFETAIGSEIYTADPVTAGNFFQSVDSVAKSIASDAQLIFVFSGHQDSTGLSIRWIYIFRSVSEQKDIELWYHDGKIVQRNAVSIPYMFNENNEPITEQWIDSDVAMVKADNTGGKEFRKTHKIIVYEISLMHFFWQINYVAQDTIFKTSIDATLN